MRPPERRETGEQDLFRSRLDQIIDLKHPLVALGRTVDWGFLEREFGAVYSDDPGRPPLPTRLMAGLAILKHTYDLSDEVLCERWVENPYYQFFCGEEFFQHRLVFDRSSLILGYTADPVGSGLVESLARPGGNITGLATYLPELASKQFELLTAVVPNLSRVGILMNPNNLAYVGMLKTTRAVAAGSGIKLDLMEARSIEETTHAFEKLDEQVEAVMIVPDPVYDPPRTLVADLALKRRLPSIHPYAEYTALGGLMSYGDSLGKFYRRAAYFVDKIFKGVQPRDLPVEQPTTFQFVINLKTAKTLGLDVPTTLLARADEVIE